MHSVSGNFIVSVISRLITGGINVFLISVLTRALSQSGYGEYSLVFAYLAIFLALADLGLYSYLIRKISQDENHESNIIGSILTLRLFSTIFFIGISFIGLFIVPYSLNTKFGIVVGSIFLISTSLIQILTAVYQKYLRMTDLAVLDVVTRIAYLIAVFALYHVDAQFISYIIALSFIELIHLLLVYWRAQSITSIRLSFSLPDWKSSMIESYPIALSLFFVLLYFKFDTILLSFYRPTEDVAIYTLGYKILEAIIFFPAMYVGIVMPQLSRAFSKDIKEAHKISAMIWNALWIGAMPTVAFVFIYAKDIIHIFTPEDFVGADMVLRILALAMIPIFLGNLGGNALIASHLQRKAMWIYGIAAVLNITGNLIFMPHYGVYSAAWMTLVTEIVVTSAMFAMIYIKLGQRLPLRSMFGSIALSIVIGLFIVFFKISAWPGFFIFLLYIPLLFAFKVIKSQELVDTLNIKNSG